MAWDSITVLFRPFGLLCMSWTLGLYSHVGIEGMRGKCAFENRRTVNRVPFTIDSHCEDV